MGDCYIYMYLGETGGGGGGGGGGGAKLTIQVGIMLLSREIVRMNQMLGGHSSVT